MDEYGTVKDYTPYLKEEMPNSLRIILNISQSK